MARLVTTSARHVDHRVRARRVAGGVADRYGGLVDRSTSRGGAPTGGPTSSRNCGHCDGRTGPRVTTSGGSWRRASSGWPRVWAGATLSWATGSDGRTSVRGRCLLCVRRGSASLTSGPGWPDRRAGVGGGHPGGRHVLDQGHDDVVRAPPRGPGRTRPDAPVDRSGPSSARPESSHNGPPAAQPSVRRHRPAGRRPVAGLGRTGVGRHRSDRGRRGRWRACLGTGDPPRLPRGHLRLARRRAGPTISGRSLGASSRTEVAGPLRWPTPSRSARRHPSWRRSRR